MHYKGYVITKAIPTQEKLSKILEPCYEGDNGENDNVFNFDWYQIGGRFGGTIKINFNPNEYIEGCCLFKERNHKYFISNLIDEIKEKNPFCDELDVLKYMGIWDKVLYVDGGYCHDIIDFDITNCSVIIDDEQNIFVRYYNDGTKNKNFDKEINGLDLNDKFITVIDFHD